MIVRRPVRPASGRSEDDPIAIWQPHDCETPSAQTFRPADDRDQDQAYDRHLKRWILVPSLRSIVKVNLTAGALWVCPVCGSPWRVHVPFDSYFSGWMAWWNRLEERDETGRSEDEFVAWRLRRPAKGTGRGR